MPKPPRSTGILLAVVLLAGLVVGCAKLRAGLPLSAPTTGVTEAALREELVSFTARAIGVVSSAGDAISDATDAPHLRKRTLVWRLRMVPLFQSAAFQEDPRTGYVHAYTLAVMMRQYFVDGEGRELFGAQQPIAVAASRRLEEDLVEIGDDFLTADEVVRIEKEVEEFARRRPIGGTDFAAINVEQALTEVRAGDRFGWVSTIPMTPFRALEGVSSGASAIHDFNDTALRFAAIVESLPEQIRWQAELLLYDAESRTALGGALTTLDVFAESASRIAAVVEALPADLRATLGESESALAKANLALENARALMNPLREVGAQFEQAGATWASLIRRDSDPAEPRHPFDVREWEATAKEIGVAASELQRVAAEARALIDAPQLQSALDHAEGNTRSLVDHAAWRILQLLVAFFVLLGLYRLLGNRSARQRGA